MLEPRNLRNMMSLAKLVEEWSGFADPSSEGLPAKGFKGGGSFSGSTRVSGRTGFNSHAGTGPNNQKPKQATTPDKTQGPIRRQNNQGPNNQGRGNERRLFPAEYARYKAEGLCYQCGGRFHARHVCQNKELMVLVIQDEEDEEVEEEEEAQNEEEEAQDFAECAALSTRSAMGISTPRTIKMRGMVRGVTATVLIDSGATHNFIDIKLMEQLGLEADDTRSF